MAFGQKKMTTDEFANVEIPRGSDATEERVLETLEIIKGQADHCEDARTLAFIAMEIKSLVRNQRVHPAAVSDLVRTVGNGVWDATHNDEMREAD